MKDQIVKWYVEDANRDMVFKAYRCTKCHVEMVEQEYEIICPACGYVHKKEMEQNELFT